MPPQLKDLSLHAIVAGFLAVVISYSGPLAIYFQAGDKAGLSSEMMTSWVWAISMGAAVSGIALSLWLRVPIVTAWSAPGTALLVSLFPALSVPEAVGAYITAAALILLISVTGSFDRLVRMIPRGVGAGMMAGILFQFGVGAFHTIEIAPTLAVGMLVAYLLFRRLMPKYTLALLLLTGIILAMLLENASLESVTWALATPQLITPEWSLEATLSLALPLVLVSLTGQYLPGMAILHSAGYRVQAKPVLAITSLASLPTALFGGITTVIAAITAAICTGKDAHDNPDRRYIAGVFNGLFYLVGALFAGTIVSLFQSLPPTFVTVLAGLALLGAISSNLHAALEDPQHREASLIAFIVTASGLTLFGLSSAFWGVIIGSGSYFILNRT